jgi:RNA polymerase sigma factor (sigma-70 family)
MMGDDQEVVTGFLRGDAEAVGTIDVWISRAAWPYQRRLADAWDDVLQDVRLEITRLLGQGKFRGESSLRTYLWRVVSHTCLDQLRSRGKRQWTDLEEVERNADNGDGRVQVAPTRTEDRDLLLRVLGKVSPDCRELWRLIVHGLSYREMSLRLGVAEGTLRVRVLRCREKAVAAREDLLADPRVKSGSQGRNTAPLNAPNKAEG